MFTSRGGDNCVGLFTAVVDRMEQNFASIVLVRHCFILSEHSNKTVHWPKYAASHAQSCCCLSANGLKIKEEIKRGTKRNVCGAVSISCLLIRVCGQAANRRVGKEQVVLSVCSSGSASVNIPLLCLSIPALSLQTG